MAGRRDVWDGAGEMPAEFLAELQDEADEEFDDIDYDEEDEEDDEDDETVDPPRSSLWDSLRQ